MEYNAKMMSQHLTSMLEHLKVSSLISKTRNTPAPAAPSSSSNNHNIDQPDSSALSNNRATNNHDNNGDNLCDVKLLANNPNGINVNFNNQIQANGTKVKEENNVGTISKCNDINNTPRQVTNNSNSCVVVVNRSSNPVLEIIPPPSTNYTTTCPMISMQQPLPHQQQQRKQSFVIKPIKLKNVMSQVETYDTLYPGATEVSKYVLFFNAFLYRKKLNWGFVETSWNCCLIIFVESVIDLT